jgi:hypothetical protein
MRKNTPSFLKTFEELEEEITWMPRLAHIEENIKNRTFYKRCHQHVTFSNPPRQCTKRIFRPKMRQSNIVGQFEQLIKIHSSSSTEELPQQPLESPTPIKAPCEISSSSRTLEDNDKGLKIYFLKGSKTSFRCFTTTRYIIGLIVIKI